MPVSVKVCEGRGRGNRKGKSQQPSRLAMKLNRIKGHVDQLSSAREGLD